MAFFGLISNKAKALTNRVFDDPTRRVLSWFLGGKKTGIGYSEHMAAEAAMIHPIVYRVINKLATSVQGVTWYVEPTGEKGVAQPTAAQLKAIQRVLDDPSDSMDSGQFKYWLALQKACFGRFALKVGVGTDGLPNALFPLQASFFATEISRAGTIKQYTYGSGENVENMPPRSAVDPARLGIFERSFGYEYVTPNLTGSSLLKSANQKNNSPLNSIGLPASVIQMLLQRAADTASGHPNIKYIVSAEKTMDTEQEDQLKAEFDEREVGAEKSGNVLLITNTTVKVDKLDNGLEDIHTKVPMDDMTRMIYSSFGIPIALAGIGSSDAAKFASNFDASRRSFYEDTLIPAYCEPIAAGLTAAICPRGARIRWDYDTVPAVADIRANKAVKLAQVLFLTDEEKRELCGFPAIPEKGTLHVNDPKTPGAGA